MHIEAAKDIVESIIELKAILIPFLLALSTILWCMLHWLVPARNHRWYYTRCYQSTSQVDKAVQFCSTCLYGPYIKDFENQICRIYPEISYYSRCSLDDNTSSRYCQTLQSLHTLYIILRGSPKDFKIACSGSSEMFFALQKLIATLGVNDSPAFLNVLFTIIIIFRLPLIKEFCQDVYKNAGILRNEGLKSDVESMVLLAAITKRTDFIPSFGNLSASEQEWTRTTLENFIDIRGLVLGELPPEAIRDFVRLIQSQSWNKAKTVLLLSVVLMSGTGESKNPFDSIDSQVCRTLKYFTDGRIMSSSARNGDRQHTYYALVKNFPTLFPGPYSIVKLCLHDVVTRISLMTKRPYLWVHHDLYRPAVQPIANELVQLLPIDWVHNSSYYYDENFVAERKNKPFHIRGISLWFNNLVRDSATIESHHLKQLLNVYLEARRVVEKQYYGFKSEIKSLRTKSYSVVDVHSVLCAKE